MPELSESRVADLLTICRKAGKLLLGFDPVRDALQQKNVFCILLASDISAKTEKEIRFFAGDTPIRKLPMTMDMLRAYFRKRTAVFGICEAGFAAKLLQLLPQNDMTEPS